MHEGRDTTGHRRVQQVHAAGDVDRHHAGRVVGQQHRAGHAARMDDVGDLLAREQGAQAHAVGQIVDALGACRRDRVEPDRAPICQPRHDGAPDEAARSGDQDG
jgi:hypothetical protein